MIYTTMEFVYDDVIMHIYYHCDNISKYFMMQLNKRFAKLIKYYNINILNIESYCAFHKTDNICKWFASANMIISNNNNVRLMINAAIKSHNNTVLMKLNILTLSIEHIKLAVKAGNNELIKDLAPNYIKNPNRSTIAYIIKCNNIELMKMIVKQSNIRVDDHLLNMACDNLSMMDVFRPFISECVCYLSTKNKQIIHWCKCNENILVHTNFTDLFDAIESNNNDNIMRLLEKYIDHYMKSSITSNNMLLPIMLLYIKSNDFDKFKMMLRFYPINVVVMNNIIKYNRLDMLKYVNLNINIVTVCKLNVIKYGNIEIVKYLHEIQYLEAALIKSLAISHGRFDIFEWVDTINTDSHAHGCNFTSVACMASNLDMLIELRTRKYDWDKHVLYIAYKQCDWKMFKWCYNNGCPVDEQMVAIIKKIKNQFGNQFFI